MTKTADGYKNHVMGCIENANIQGNDKRVTPQRPKPPNSKITETVTKNPRAEALGRHLGQTKITTQQRKMF